MEPRKALKHSINILIELEFSLCGSCYQDLMVPSECVQSALSRALDILGIVELSKMLLVP